MARRDDKPPSWLEIFLYGIALLASLWLGHCERKKSNELMSWTKSQIESFQREGEMAAKRGKHISTCPYYTVPILVNGVKVDTKAGKAWREGYERAKAVTA